MLEKPSSAPANNSLAPPASLALDAAPPFGSVGEAKEQEGSVPSLQALRARAAVNVGASAEEARGASYPSAAVCALGRRVVVGAAQSNRGQTHL